MTPVQTILRKASRTPGEPLNILCGPTHERVESNIAKTGHRFWAHQHQSFKGWVEKYAALPSNYTLLPKSEELQVPPDIELDIVLSQNKFGQAQQFIPFARRMGLPIISVEHTAPPREWPAERLAYLRSLRGDLNVFISAWSAEQWGWDLSDPSVRIVEHGLDTELFQPGSQERKKALLSVCNDWINRDYFCGYSLWKEVTKGLPVRVVGDTPGLSKPATSTAELVHEYQSAKVFVNTSQVSPIPMSLLESMACGCAVVSSATCHIPRIITHGVNGLMSNDPKELRHFCELLLKDEDFATELGTNARKTIEEKFSLGRFVREWDEILREAAELNG